MARMARLLLALTVTVLLGAGPATALTPPAAGLVRAPLVVAPTFLPMYCGSLCSPAAPTLVVEAGGGLTAQVPTGVAMSGGYVAKAGGVAAGLSIVGSGGLVGWLLGNQNTLPWSAESDGTVELPPGETITGAVSRTWQGRNNYGQMQEITFTVEIPVKSGATPWREATVTATSSPTVPPWRPAPECDGVQQAVTGWWSGSSSTDWGTVTCPAPAVITGLRISTVSPSGDRQWFDFPVGEHDPDWSPEPKRWIQTTTDCMDAEGDISTVTHTGPVTPSPDEWAMPATACPAGSIAVEVEADLVADGEYFDLGAAAMPTPFRDVLKQCIGLDCTLGIGRKGGGEPTETDLKKRPENLECLYGAATIPMEYCAPLLKPPVSGKVPVPIEDPEAPGNPKPNPIFDPPPDPSPDPNPEPVPDPAPGEDEWACPGLDDVGLGDILTGRVVYLAGACAMNWAFVPRPSVVRAQTESIMGRLEDTAPYTAVVGGVGILQDLSGVLSNMGGGCAGPSLEFAGIVIKPVNLCDAPLSTYAGWIKAATSLAMIVFVVFNVTSSIAGSFNIRMPWEKPQEIQGTLW